MDHRYWQPEPSAGQPSSGQSAPQPAGPPGPPVAPWQDPANRKPHEHKVGGIGWDIMLYINLGLIGLGILAGTADLLFRYSVGDADGLGTMNETFIVATLVIAMLANLFMMGGIPFLWAAMTRAGGWEGTKEFLALRMKGSDWLWTGIMWIGFLFFAVGISFLLTLLGVDEGSSTIDGILDVLNWPLAILIAFCAGVGEEILFRGVLQKWLKWWGQAIVFGFAHAAAFGELQVIITMILGFGFGYARHKGVSLPALMLVHFLYDLTLLGLVLTVPESFWEGEAIRVWRF